MTSCKHMVSVFYFTPLPGFFSPFPHGTCSLSVTREYFEFLIFRLQDYHLLRYRFPTTSTILRLSSLLMESFNPNPKIGLGCSPFARHYLGNRLLSFFSSGYLDVSVHRVALYKVMYSLYDTSSFLLVGSPIRKSPDQSILTTPRSISLFVTSFFSF